jgi:3-dehydroquinate dehydratase II
MKLIIINGPNLNLLGVREKSIYGDKDFETYYQELKTKYKSLELSYFQSNHEGELIDKIHAIGFDYDGIILNAGGLTHTSVALTDAVAGVKTPTVEVHISNIHAREEFRHHSFLTKNCKGIIAGLGLKGYELAIEYFL